MYNYLGSIFKLKFFIKVKQSAISVISKLLDSLGWIKIIFQSGATIFGMLAACDLTKFLNNSHPATIFVHWLLFSHPLRICLLLQVILLLIAILEKAQIGSYSKLRKELDNTQKKLDILNNCIKELFEGILMSFAIAELGFGNNQENGERISLYIAKQDSNSSVSYLYPIGRYSSNPIYRQIRRKKYSVHKGCIGEAYRNDYCYNGYVTETVCTNLYSYSPAEFQEMRMKSRTLAAISLTDRQNHVIGVLVAESKEQDWQKNSIKKKLEKQAQYLTDMYLTLKNYIDDKVDNTISENGGMPW